TRLSTQLTGYLYLSDSSTDRNQRNRKARAAMRMTQLVFRTLREDQTEAELASHQLMLRAGLIRQVASGIYAYLPLGQRVKKRIEAIVRQEMDAVGGQEVTLPVVHPAELWRKSGRWDEMGDDLARLKDRTGRDLCLGMTHEEVVTALASHFINSYRMLPCMLYQVQTKFRDERRPRGGLIRVREFTMKDGYSFHPNSKDLDDFYPSVYEAYFRVFRRCGLDVLTVQSDTGIMGGSMAHEFMALTPDGEDALLICDQCEYRANRQIASRRKPIPVSSAPMPIEEVYTPGSTTIDALASYLDTTPEHTAKAVFFIATLRHDTSDPSEKFVFAVVRGDMALNETKLANLVKALSLRPATETEIRDVGAEPGYGSPIGVDRSNIILVVDDIIPNAPNLIAGANRTDHHFRNVNYERDYSADIVGDIVAADEGDACPDCGAGMRTARGI
ncbi:MAG: proline--tRNA ligase, partial [Candidatus Latescibacteria bacterium]|nr:proline--tRNA ligase [Candidatus Latescibacterota bacterium]